VEGNRGLKDRRNFCHGKKKELPRPGKVWASPPRKIFCTEPKRAGVGRGGLGAQRETTIYSSSDEKKKKATEGASTNVKKNLRELCFFKRGKKGVPAVKSIASAGG